MSLHFYVFAAAGLLSVAAALPATSGSALEAFRWTARPVVVFAPAADASGASDQIGRLRKAHATLAERQMPVFVVRPTRVTTLAGESVAIDAASLRKAYRVEPDAFAVILIGKDGGEKFRAAEPVDADRLTGLVDGMPMRRQEIR